MSRRDKNEAEKQRDQVDAELKETAAGGADSEQSEPGESAAEAGRGAAPAGELEALKARLDEKDREIAELKDKYLRAMADVDNIRKRVRQQSEETIRLQRESLLRDLLPIIDNLERAVAAAQGGGNGKPIVDGVQMVLASMLDLLRQQGVTPEESIGRPFDPACHEAIDHVPSETHPPDTVVEEFHRGYRIGERMLRPARVVVAKAAESAGGDPGEKPENEN